jgi:hypothetical protein
MESLKNQEFSGKRIEVPFGLEVQQIFHNLLVHLVIPYFANEDIIKAINDDRDTVTAQDVRDYFTEKFKPGHAIYIGLLGIDKYYQYNKHDVKKHDFLIQARLCYKALRLFNLASSVY